MYIPRWADAHKALTVYYALQIDWPGCGVMNPADKPLSGTSKSSLPGLIAWCCDIGTAIKVAAPRQEELIKRRYYHWFRARDYKTEINKMGSRLSSAVVSEGAGKIIQDKIKMLSYDSDAHDRMSRTLSRRKAYTAALNRVAKEIEARDLFARASIGEWARISGVPEA